MKNYIPFLFILLSLYVLYPYFGYILFGIVLYGIVKPLYYFFCKIIKYKSLSAAISLILLIVFFVIPLGILSYYFYLSIKNVHIHIPFIPNILQYIIGRVGKEFIGDIIAIFCAFFLLIEEEKIYEIIKKYELENFVNSIKKKFYGIIYGYIFFWMLQTLLSYIGFIALGIPHPILLTFLVLIFCALPVVGPWTVWLFVVLYLIYKKMYFVAALAAIYGWGVVSGICELVIRPYIVSKTAEIHPLLVFLGVVCGVVNMGIGGIFVGPIVLEICKDIIKGVVYGNDINKIFKNQ